MRTFRTTDGASWDLAVNVLTVKRCRDMTGVNPLALVSEQSAVADLFSDDVKLCEVLCAFVLPQLEERGKRPDDFYATINGDVIEQAAEALLGEIIDFFQEPRRGLLKKAFAKQRQAVEAIRATNVKLVEQRIDEMDLERALALTLSSSASDSPASSG